MKSRRQFVREGAIAATAILVAQHLKAFSGLTSAFPGNSSTVFSNHTNHLVFLHSAETDNTATTGLVNYLKKIQSPVHDTLLINTGAHRLADNTSGASPAGGIHQIDKEYKIIRKAGVNTGIIYARPTTDGVIKQSEDLAAFLKKEKNCQLVVCISHLGHQHKNAPDDVTLAGESRHIDIILNGHTTNFLSKTITMPNSARHEVIIQSSRSNTAPFAKLEIGMDANGNKKLIHLATKLYKDISAA